MRILHVVPTYYPAIRYGGTIYSVHALCRSLAAAGHDVHVYTTSVDGSENSAVPHGQPVELDCVQIHYFPSRWLRRIYYSADFAAQMNATIRNFDVVHLHSVFLYPTWAAARAAANAKIPYVLSPRGMLVRDLIRHRNALVKLGWINLIERATLAGASRIHLTSEVERRELIGLGLALAPTTVISNGVDAPASFSPGEVSEDVRALIASGYDILSFGRINWKKGLDELIRAIAPLHSVKLLIAGNDESKFVTKLRSIAGEFGVRDRVYFLSRQIVGADKEALFSAARLFVLPSLSENFGNVVTEAMIRSVPVVVSEHVGAAEIVAASGGGVVVPNVEADLTDAIGCLFKSNKRLADAGSAGAAYARDKLTWQSVAGHFEQMYREVLKRKLTDRVHSA